MDRLKHCIVGSLEIYPTVFSLYSGGTRKKMEPNVNQYLHGYKMVIKGLGYLILKDAAREDLLPTALISKYDVTLERLMYVLKSMLNEGYLTLTDGKWLRITEKGRLSEKEIEESEIQEIEGWKSSYMDEFSSRNNTVEVNEPYLPSIEGLKKIMEGAGHKETSNEK